MMVPGIWTQASSSQSRMLYPLGQDNHVIGEVIQALFKEDEMTLILTLIYRGDLFFFDYISAGITSHL